MEIEKTETTGLARAYRITFTAKNMREALDAKLNAAKDEVQLKGFRPGKVPLPVMRRFFGKRMSGEVLQEKMKEGLQTLLEDKEDRPAYRPETHIIEGGGPDLDKDLVISVRYEVTPEFDIQPHGTMQLVKPVYAPGSEDEERALAEVCASARRYEDKKDAAEKGDQLVVDFTGRIDGRPFAGGQAADIELTLGEGRFIPGFEEQLEGVRTGEARDVKARFPDAYHESNLAGKEAQFDVQVKAVRSPVEEAPDDALAKRLGLDSLDALKEKIREELLSHYGQHARKHLKRALMDELDTRYAFDIPKRLITMEKEQLSRSEAASVDGGEDSGASEEADPPENGEKKEKDVAAEQELEKLAERRVKLGLVLARIGRDAKISLSERERNSALIEHARLYQGNEKEAYAYFKDNPEIASHISAPIYEEKVVDYLLGKIKIEEKPVSREKLLADPDGNKDILTPEGQGA